MPYFDPNQLKMFQKSFNPMVSPDQQSAAQQALLQQQAQALQDAKVTALQQVLQAPSGAPEQEMESDGIQGIWDRLKAASGRNFSLK